MANEFLKYFMILRPPPGGRMRDWLLMIKHLLTLSLEFDILHQFFVRNQLISHQQGTWLSINLAVGDHIGTLRGPILTVHVKRVSE